MGSKYFLTWALVIVFLYFLGLEAYIHKLGADCPYLDKECFMLECPKKPFQQYEECDAHCPRTCGNFEADKRALRKECLGKCIPGCSCVEDYAYNSNWECVELKFCQRAIKAGQDPAPWSYDDYVDE